MPRRDTVLTIIVLVSILPLTSTLILKSYTYLETLFTLVLITPSLYLLTYMILSLYLGIPFEPPLKLYISYRGLSRDVGYIIAICLLGLAFDGVATLVSGRTLLSELATTLALLFILYLSRKIELYRRIAIMASISITILIPLYLLGYINEDMNIIEGILSMFEGG